MTSQSLEGAPGRLPAWLKVKLGGGRDYARVRRLLEQDALHTVCQEARCPNMGECFESGTATFLILGDVCTRNCRFCAVRGGHPSPPDPQEPERLAQAVRHLELDYVVVTSVTRDDLPDGGAAAFAATIRAVRRARPGCRVEVLVPDFGGSAEALAAVMDSRPDVLNHNLETVPRLYRRVRPKAGYHRSLHLLEQAKVLAGGTVTKSGLMLGLGEGREELLAVMSDLRQVGCDVLTLGQYLRPSRSHLPVARFYEPAEFDELREAALGLGFVHVEAGPLVRSSYHARRQAALIATNTADA